MSLPWSDLADWDARWETWRRSHERLQQPVLPGDEYDLWNPGFTNNTVADMKRAVQGASLHTKHATP